MGPQTYMFRCPERRLLVVLSPSRLFLQTLGLSPWADAMEEHLRLALASLKALGVTQLKRVGFKILAYLPLQMSHAELCRLMFGSFLAPIEELREVFGDPLDPSVHLEGKYGESEYVVEFTPVTTEQAKARCQGIPNVDHFVTEKFAGSPVREFLDRVCQSDSLVFDVDLFRKDLPVDKLGQFLSTSLQDAKRIAEATVARLQSRPIAKGN